MTATAPVLAELGFYTLAGQPNSSHDLVAEVTEGEALGLGTAGVIMHGATPGELIPIVAQYRATAPSA